MKVAVFSAKRYDRELLAAANAEAGHELVFFDDLLETSTVALTAGCGAVCVFVNDPVDAPVLAARSDIVSLQCPLTREAIGTICATTIASITAYGENLPLEHEVHAGI